MDINNVMIFGDSYSTFEGYVPEGNAVYYTKAGNPNTDVRKVEETWWHQVITELGCNLVLNDSWSGSTIGYTGYNNSDCSQSSSFIYRLKKFKEQDFFNKNNVDTVLVFGGTNDSWCNAPLGDLKFFDWEETELYSVLPAITYYLKNLKETLLDANIICIINTELKSEITECLAEACAKYGIKAIRLQSVNKNAGHPTIEGMKNIKDEIIEALSK